MREDIEQYAEEIRSGLKADKTENFLNSFKTLDQFEEQEPTWIIPGWIPEGQIVLMASEGGTGKTSTWVDILASLSRGGSCILDPPGYIRKPARTVFLTTEDSIRKKLRKKLRLAGAKPELIVAPDFANNPELLHDLKFGSPKIAEMVRWFSPALVVFDPVQGFVPPKANMGSRNEMRDCLSPLISLGEETGTSFLLVCHTNKRKGAYGRDRIADSADLWDIARSVIMAGYTEDEGIRYLSNEKNNYAQLQDTILYSFDDDGLVRPEGTSWKRDRDYMQASSLATSAPKRDDCKEWLVNELQEAGGEIPSKELEELAKSAGYSFATLRRAKDALKKAGCVRNYASGSARGGDREWFVQLVPCEDTV